MGLLRVSQSAYEPDAKTAPLNTTRNVSGARKEARDDVGVHVTTIFMLDCIKISKRFPPLLIFEKSKTTQGLPIDGVLRLVQKSIKSHRVFMINLAEGGGLNC